MCSSRISRITGIQKIDPNYAIESSRDYLRGIFVKTTRCDLEVVGDRLDRFALARIPELNVKTRKRRNFAGSIVGAADQEMIVLFGAIYTVYERGVALELAL